MLPAKNPIVGDNLLFCSKILTKSPGGRETGCQMHHNYALQRLRAKIMQKIESKVASSRFFNYLQ